MSCNEVLYCQLKILWKMINIYCEAKTVMFKCMHTFLPAIPDHQVGEIYQCGAFEMVGLQMVYSLLCHFLFLLYRSCVVSTKENKNLCIAYLICIT